MGTAQQYQIQESTLLLAMNKVARKKSCISKITGSKPARRGQGQERSHLRLVLPSDQRRRGEVADMVNDLRIRTGDSQVSAAFKPGSLGLNEGDYVIRADQPYHTWPTCISACRIIHRQPRAVRRYRWTMQYMRNVKLVPVTDKMDVPGAHDHGLRRGKSSGRHRRLGQHLVLDHTTDNA